MLSIRILFRHFSLLGYWPALKSTEETNVVLLHPFSATVYIVEQDERVGSLDISVTIPRNYSYYCDEAMTITNVRDGSLVVLTDIRVSYLNLLNIYEYKLRVTLFVRDGLLNYLTDFSQILHTGAVWSNLKARIVFFFFFLGPIW